MTRRGWFAGLFAAPVAVQAAEPETLSAATEKLLATTDVLLAELRDGIRLRDQIIAESRETIDQLLLRWPQVNGNLAYGASNPYNMRQVERGLYLENPHVISELRGEYRGNLYCSCEWCSGNREWLS